ncbi:MAG: hypothetical protein MJZ87_11025, partial [Bacteroidales bacterium]|nr:hypothetical protein [Bacteroidales bacterium]
SLIISWFSFSCLYRTHVKLTDNFCWFWLHFMEQDRKQEDFWQVNENKPAVRSWCGIAFEEVCFNHIRQIKQALGISGVTTRISSFIEQGDNHSEGMQIDMIIDRDDRVLNLCEMKFVQSDFAVDRDYSRKIANRVQFLLQKENRTIHSTLITTYGLKYNEYSGSFQKTITLDDLFVG